MDDLKVVVSRIIADIDLPPKLNLVSPFLPNAEPSTTIVNAPASFVSPIITLSGTTPTINCGNGDNRIFEITLTGNTTYSIMNVAIGQAFIVRAKQGSGTSYTNTWFSTLTWITSGGTAPAETTTSSGVTTYGFLCRAPGIFDGYLLGTQ